MRYDTTRHAKFKLRYHVIFVTKYRYDCLSKPVQAVIRQAFLDSRTDDFDIELCEFDDTKPNRVHLLISATPNVAPYQIIARLKQYSTYLVWQQIPQIMSKAYWRNKHYLWTRGYFVYLIGEASEATIRKYIENQG